jgi:hypothetical protein
MMSQPHDRERRDATLSLLRAIGFRNVTTAKTIAHVRVKISMKYDKMAANFHSTTQDEVHVGRMTAENLLAESLFRRMSRRKDLLTEEHGARYAANALVRRRVRCRMKLSMKK